VRIFALVLCSIISGCVSAVESAPVQFKATEVAGQKFDGVSLAVLCELADRVGTEYQAADVESERVANLQRELRYLQLLDVTGATCAKAAAPINLAFVAEPQRRLVSTWGGMQVDGYEEVWGSCLADTTREPGNRVLFCEVGSGMESNTETLTYLPPVG